MAVTNQQVRKLMTEYAKTGNIGKSGLKAGMSRNTASKYLTSGKLPSELKQKRTWRTREDPFSEVWGEISAKLSDAPELEGKALFEWLQGQYPGRFSEGQVRTFQRRVKRWRATSGPMKEVFFPQQHRPGEAGQTDFTHGTELQVTIRGVLFAHLLCVFVLPYSNWQWVTVCLSESYLAIKRGVQSALFALGCHPVWHQTDNSTAATHSLPAGLREFNQNYVDFMDHFGMKPRTIEPGKKEQNGDVEASNRALKRRLEQHLLLRGSRDFESEEAYESWVQSVVANANMNRTERLNEELAVMRPVAMQRLPEFVEETYRVSKWSTIRVKENTYSVPSRLIRERVAVRLYERHLEVYYAQQKQLEIPRVTGVGQHRINYRHVIWSLVRKPGAFERYRYRDDMFPTLTFRKAYDALGSALSGTKRDLAYVRLLHHAASTCEADVETAVALLLESSLLPTIDAVKDVLSGDQHPPPAIAVPEVKLDAYDRLLGTTTEAPKESAG